MPVHKFNIPQDKAMEVAQNLAHRIATRHGMSMLTQLVGKEYKDPNLIKLITQSNERTQQIIDDILNKDSNK